MSRRRFVTDMPVTPEFLRLVDHVKHDVWLRAAPWDAVEGSVVVEKLFIPTDPTSHRSDSITVRVYGSAEQLEPLR